MLADQKTSVTLVPQTSDDRSGMVNTETIEPPYSADKAAETVDSDTTVSYSMSGGFVSLLSKL